MKFFSVVIVLAVLMSGCGSGPKLPPLSADAVILAFGDSLTAGTGASAETSYPAVLNRLSGRKVINAGVPGETTAGGIARLEETLEREKPVMVILCLGGNDFLQRLDQEKAEQNIRAMVSKIRERGVAVVLIGVPRIGFGLEVPEWYGKVAKDNKIPYEGKVLAKILGDSSLKSDAVHPNAAGYERLAIGIDSLLKKSGALPQ